jgi:CRP/FNR family cyclic AMP-dependent transcriptional regulator
MDATPWMATLRAVEFGRGVPDAALERLAQAARPRRIHAGELVLLEGDRDHALYIVAEGSVKMVRTSAGGREQVMAIIGAGGHFNTVATFDEAGVPADVVAATAGIVLGIPRPAVLAVMADCPQLAEGLLRTLSGRLRALVDIVDELALHSVRGRLAALLLEQAGAGPLTTTPTHAELAARLGTVREVVSRNLKALEHVGLIRVHRGVIELVDPAGLRTIAER